MITPEETIQLRAFVRYDGLLLAILWTVSFACYIIGLSNPAVSMLAVGLVLSSPFFVAQRLKVFRDYGREGVISFLRGWAYVALTFFHASLLLAVVYYVYFAFLDHGYFLQSIHQLLNSPENQQVLSQYATVEEFNQLLNDMQSVRPIDLALSMLQANTIVGILLGMPIAALLKKKV